MSTIENIILFFSGYPFTISYFGAFLGGEETILVLSFLSGQGIIPAWIVFLACTLGTMSSDIFWYFLGKSKAIDWILRRKYFSSGYAKVNWAYDRLTRYNTIGALLMGKFLYGTRILTIFYLSRGKMNLKRFCGYNALIVLIWSAVIVPIGWLAGRGFSLFLDILKDFQFIVGIIIILVILVYVIHKALNRWMVHKIKREEIRRN